MGKFVFSFGFGCFRFWNFGSPVRLSANTPILRLGNQLDRRTVPDPTSRCKAVAVITMLVLSVERRGCGVINAEGPGHYEVGGHG